MSSSARLREFDRVVHAQRALLAQHFRRAIAQHLLGAAIEQAHDVVGVDGDDRDLGGGVQQGLQLGLRVARGALLVLGAIEQAAQLRPQRVDLLAAEVDVGLAGPADSAGLSSTRSAAALTSWR